MANCRACNSGLIALLVLAVIDGGLCKVYDRCELARELRDEHELPQGQIATWVCIARHESEYNTSAMNPGSGDHGLFQISQLFWCSPPGWACGLSCNDLRDDDIEDDVICARRIWREHQRLSGDGFNAWVVYNQYCRDASYKDSLVKDCFTEKEVTNSIDKVEKTAQLPEPDYYPHISDRRKQVTTSTTSTSTSKKYGDAKTKYETTKTLQKSTKPLTNYFPKSLLYKTTKPLSTFTTKTLASFTTKPLASFNTKPQDSFTTKPQGSYTTKPLASFTTKPIRSFTTKPITSYTTKFINSPVTSTKTSKGTAQSTNKDYTYTINKTGFKFERTSL